MRKLLFACGVSLVTLLAACGGGGGSAGNTAEQYSITLRADKTTLPVNVGNVAPGAGVNYPYTTTLYVSAKEGDDPIPGGDDIFGCNISAGLDSGALVYLNGTEHQTTDADGNTVESLYRSITLASNSGGNSFHFHAGDQAGTATITCTVTDPRDSRVYSASVDITVGGGSGTGKPASVYAIAKSNSLGTQYNTNDIPNNVGINAIVMDDNVQPVPDPAAANVRIRILTNTASSGARLLLGSQSGSTIYASTTGGVALFSLSSGPSRGAIFLELTTDRYDNDVTNGIQDPIVQWASIPVIEGYSTTMTFTSVALTAANGTPFAAALEVEGGTPSYTWSVISGSLPTGLYMSSNGVINGTPLTTPGSYVVGVRVTDAYGYYTDGTVTITVTGTPISVSSATISAQPNVAFSYTLSASGGVSPYTWSVLGTMPAGLTLDSNGVISGTPTTIGTYSVAVQVTDRTGASATTTLTFNIGVTLAISTTNIAATTGSGFSYVLKATGGVSPYTWAVVGTKPAWLTITTAGIASGTPPLAGTYSVAIQVTDSTTPTASVVLGTLTITVTDP